MSRRRGPGRVDRGRSPRSLGELVSQFDRRALRSGEVPAVGQVVYSDGVTEFVLVKSSDNDVLRNLIASHCDECAKSLGIESSSARQ